MAISETATPLITRTDTTLIPSGSWTLNVLKSALQLPGSLNGPPVLEINGSKVTELDTSGASMICSVVKSTGANPKEVKLSEFTSQSERLLRLVLGRSPDTSRTEHNAKPPLIESLAKPLESMWNATLNHLSFLGETLNGVFDALSSPRNFRISDLIIQIERAGIRAIPIVSLVTFLIGLVVAYLFSNQAEKFGASIFVVDAIGMGMCRELSPVLTAIIVAGRSGSAFTAQIGSMKISDEVDAIRVMGLSPIHVLVIPRVLALILVLPFLVFIGNVLGISGGYVIANAYLHIPSATFLDRLQSVLALKHVWVGLGKAPLFALIIALIGCRQGLTVEDNARSVGLHTTATVVQSIVAVIILDALLAVLFQELGW